MKLRVPHPRLLPITITALCAMIVVKTIDLVQVATGSITVEASMMSGAWAATPGAGKAADAGKPGSEANDTGASAAAPAPRAARAADQTRTATDAARPAEPVADAVRGAEPSGDKPAGLIAHVTPSAEPAPPPVGEAERALLQDLRSRKLELDARDRATAEREAVLSAAEHKLSDRVEQLTALQTRLEALDADRKQHDEANWAGLVRTYEAMKPRDAAVIFNDLDLAVLLPVLDRMKEVKAALVLAAMQPERARLVTARLAQQRNQPSVVAAGG